MGPDRVSRVLRVAFALSLVGGVARAQFDDLGGGLPGVDGVPVLSGEAETGSPSVPWPYAQVHLSVIGAPNSVAYFVLGLDVVYLPIFGGILVPRPDLITAVSTGTSGLATVDIRWPNVTGPIYVQVGVADAAAVEGIAFSNTLAITGAPMSAVDAPYLESLLYDAVDFVVDQAEAELATRGVGGIEALMEVASQPASTATSSGSFVFASWSNRWNSSPDSVRRRAFFVIDGILDAVGPTPYENTALVDYSGVIVTEAGLDTAALALYQQWWGAAGGLSLSFLQALPRPLELAPDIAWGGAPWHPPVTYPPWTLGATGPGPWCLPGTDTLLGAVKLAPPNFQLVPANAADYAIFPPKVPGGPTPQNCLGLALDLPGWAGQPEGLLAPSFQAVAQTMNSKGFTALAGPPDFSQPGPSNATVVVIVSSNKPGGGVAKWKHALRIQTDALGRWDSWHDKDAEKFEYIVPNSLLTVHVQDVIKVIKPGEVMVLDYYQK